MRYAFTDFQISEGIIEALKFNFLIIIELIDSESISRDGMDTPYNVM